MRYEQGTVTVHGFRSTASTLLNEKGWHPDAIERQLAHPGRDGMGAAYNHAEYLPERRNMMQCWSDYLNKFRAGMVENLRVEASRAVLDHRALRICTGSAKCRQSSSTLSFPRNRRSQCAGRPPKALIATRAHTVHCATGRDDHGPNAGATACALRGARLRSLGGARKALANPAAYMELAIALYY